MNNQIILLRRSMYQLSATCNNKRNEIAYLQNQIQVLEGHINGLENRNQQQQQEEEIQNESYTWRFGYLSLCRKVGRYHSYATKNLRAISDKPLFFNAAISNGSIDNPIFQSQVAPNTRDNVIYDIHMYPPSYYNMQFFRFASSIARNLQIFVGEFNSDYKYGATLSKDQLTKYIKLFYQFKAFGFALWRWYYIRDLNVPAFNLTNVENGRINPNTNFVSLSNTLKGYSVHQS
jgi:hypothetical protein